MLKGPKPIGERTNPSRRVQCALRHKTADEISVQIENIHEAVARPRYIIMLFWHPAWHR